MTAWPDDGDRVPFTLLGGYLGAGKTTLLNRVLTASHGRRIAVLVNDVGAVAVDAALIARHDGPTLALSNGCVCCTIGDDLGEALEQVRSLPDRPDHVVMELSGVTEPARMVPWARTRGFRLDGVVVAADADQIVELAERRYVGDAVRAQLAAGDVVVLTKTDLVADGAAGARGFIGGVVSARTPIVDAAELPAESLLGVWRTSPSERDRSPSPPHSTPLDVVELPVGRPTLDELASIVAGLPESIVRAKGLVACRDTTSPVEVHLVGRRREVRERPDLDPAAASSSLVLIGAPGEVGT